MCLSAVRWGMLCSMGLCVSSWVGSVVQYGSVCQQLGGVCCAVWFYLSAVKWGMLCSMGLFVSSWVGDVV